MKYKQRKVDIGLRLNPIKSIVCYKSLVFNDKYCVEVIDLKDNIYFIYEQVFINLFYHQFVNL